MAKRSQNQRPENVKSLSEPLQKKRQRTARVCDRCRIKKLKCDGGHCRACVKSDSVCLYTHLRHSASKNYQCQMQDIMSEGLRTLYLACKRNSCFPGPLPEISDGNDHNVSVYTILQCLGLIPKSNEVKFLPACPGALEDQFFDLGLNVKANDDLSLQAPLKHQDSAPNGLALSSPANECSLPHSYEATNQDPTDSDELFITHATSSGGGPSLASHSILKSPFSALARGDNTTTLSEALFPQVFTSPLEENDYTQQAAMQMNQHADFSHSFIATGSSRLAAESLPMIVGPERATKPKPASSYLVERERFYRSLLGSSSRALLDLHNFRPLAKDPLPAWASTSAQTIA